LPSTVFSSRIDRPDIEVAVVGDTHVPSREPAVPEAVERRLREVDHVGHVGDFDSRSALGRIRRLADELTAVRGNMDRGLSLPETPTLSVEDVTFVVTHGTGSPAGWDRRIAEAVREHAGPAVAGAASGEPFVGVAGHPHEPTDAVVDESRLLNPGSATGASPADGATMMAAEIERNALEVTLHRTR